MKDTLVNLLVFLLVFAVTAALFLGNYWISALLVPGGKGLVFANPFAAALLPALLGGLVVAFYRSTQRPGRFRITWVLLAGAFYLLLTLSIPVIQQAPPFRAADSTPLVTNRFLTLADGYQILSTPPATVLVPTGEEPMAVSTGTQYDALNQRFVFVTGEPKNLGSTGPEQAYFQYTPALLSFQTDIFALYSVLKDSVQKQQAVYWFQAAAMTWLFLGVYFFLSFRTWPMIRIILVLVILRIIVLFEVYSFWTVPALIDLWLPPELAAGARIWFPVFLVSTAAACLFFMSWVNKPHKQAELS